MSSFCFVCIGIALGCFTYIGIPFSWSFLILIIALLCVNLKKPVSYPGDERSNKLKRRGNWPNIEKKLDGNWEMLEADPSHIYSERNHNIKLLGRPEGRQIWTEKESNHKFNSDNDKESINNDESFTFCAARNPNASDLVFRSQQIKKWKGETPDESSTPNNHLEAARKGIQFYQMLQCDDGHWAGDYGGPMFLMPGLVIVCYVAKVDLGSARKRAMLQYLENHQQIDGGWGTHIECPSTMFGTVLNYVVARLLGMDKDSPMLEKAYNFIQSNGGAVMCPSWAKFWLAVLGVYDWEGINSIPVEMWLLPSWFPFHPSRLWCHCRMVYLPMGYLYCKRFAGNVDELILSIRKEIFTTPYESINWGSTRQLVSPLDEYSKLHPLMKFFQDFLALYERFPIKFLRNKALEFVIEYIKAEDKQTNYICIGPVNKSLNMLCVWEAGGAETQEFKQHVARIDDYLWVAEDGMKMQGYNGSQCWDTSFAVQAIIETGLSSQFQECLAKSFRYFEATQIATNEDNNERYFRHISKGGWPFSTSAHGWPISDCTSEGLKSVILLTDLQFIKESLGTESKTLGIIPSIDDHRYFDAINVLLSLQNHDGGWATYENNRGYGWFEWLNPSEVFGDIMIDYSYVECSTACITALISFSERYPNHRKEEIQVSIKRGCDFMKSIQRSDGSWYGSWGVCFMYATWFGIEGLIKAGESPNSNVISKAVEFILKSQNDNGGWGESYINCVDKCYAAEGAGPFGQNKSGVVQTSWALLGLMNAKSKNYEAIEKGIKFLMDKQLPNGDWNQEGITGVFNRNCGITYTAYRNIFPIWALGKYDHFKKEMEI